MSTENTRAEWDNALQLPTDKMPLQNLNIDSENLKYYLTHEEYNILLLAVQSLIDDYKTKLETGFPGGGGGGTGTSYWDSYTAIKKGATTPASDSTLYTSLMTLEKLGELKEEIQSGIDALGEKYLSKINPDTANELITFLKGLEVTDVGGKDKINITPKRLSFQHEGELGWGDTQYYIDSEGYAHLKGLILEEYLEVPELRYNRIEINIGDSWRAPGGGVILSVVESSTTTGTVTLKLDDGELGAISENDLCMGIFHFMGDGKSNNATEDTDDFETGEREIKGFATSYFQILTVSGDHTSFTYRLRPGYTVHPQPTMNFVGFGNTTNKNRQTSSYQTRTYQRYMINRDDWSYTMANISAQFGDLTTLGGDYDEYSAYLNNVYFTGKIEQVIADKIEVRLAKEKISVEKDALDQYVLGPQITSNVLSVMEGDRLLTPTNNTVEGDLKAGEYFINIDGVGITPGAISINAVDKNIAIGDSYNMTADIARIMYTIKLKRANGKSESVAKYQEISFLKGIPGEPGDDGVDGTDGTDGSGIASVVLKYAFSTDGNSKPYADGNTNWIAGIPTNTSTQKGKYLWVQTITTYTKGISTTYSYTVSYIPKDGQDGTITKWIHTRTKEKIAPVIPTDANLVVGASPQWTEGSVGPDHEYRYEWVSKKESYSEGVWTNYSYPSLWSNYAYDGSDGKDGKSVEFVYNRSNNSATPPDLIDVEDRTLEENYPGGTSALNETWSDDPRGVDPTHSVEWVSKRVKKDILQEAVEGEEPKYISLWQDYSEPVIWAKYSFDGKKGENGSGIKVKGSFETWQELETVVDPERGDGYIILGDLWVYDGVSPAVVDVSPFGWNNVGKISGDNAYFHIAYADSITFSGSTPIAQVGFSEKDYAHKAWLGTYADHTKDSAGVDEWTKYKWTHIKGNDGPGQEFVYKLMDREPALNEPIPVKKTDDNSDDNVPVGWTDDPKGHTPELPYEWTSIRKKKDGIWGPYTKPVVWTNYAKPGEPGEPGEPGTDSVSITASKEGHTYTFYSTNSTTPKGAWSDGKSTLSVYKGTQKLTYTTGALGDTNYTVTVTPTPDAGTNGIKIGSENSNFFVYPEKLPTDIINIILTVKVKVKGITEEFTKVLTYSRLNDGVAGVGVPIVYRGSWDVAKTYYGNDKRMDIVKYSDHYWKAKNVTGSSTAGFTGLSTRPLDYSSHWDRFGAEFESVATELLLAEKANIAEFAFENQTIYSQNGWIENPLGVFTEVTNSGGDINNPLFISNLYLNGKTGQLQARTGHIGGFTIHRDMLQSTHGTTPSISLNGRTGAGHLAGKNIMWDSEGNVTFGPNVTLSWSKITGAPTIPEGVSDSYIKGLISDSYIKGTVDDSYIKGIISNEFIKGAFEEAIETDFTTKITSNYITTQHINTLGLTSLGDVTAGSFSLGNGRFVVSEEGKLTANDATIKGHIEATSGSFPSSLMTGTLTADKINFDGAKGTNVDLSGKITTGLISGGKVEMDGAGLQIYNASGNMNIRFGLKNGYAVMEYYDNDGTFLYDLGPGGIGKLEIREERWDPIPLVYLAPTFAGALTDHTVRSRMRDNSVQTPTTFYRYVARIAAGIITDPNNADGKLFKNNGATIGFIDNGVYMKKVGPQHQEYMIPGTSGTRIYPPGIQPENESVFDTIPLYAVEMIQYLNGIVIATATAYWNPNLTVG